MSALYQQVSSQILDQISKGERKVGDQLPPEVEFASELGVSRSTIRLAFNQLESSGVLSRRKRAGTQIIAAEPKTQFNVETAEFEKLINFMRVMPAGTLQASTVSTEDIPELQRFESVCDQWLEIYSTRTMPGKHWPICLSRIYVPERYSKIDVSVEISGASVLSKIEQVYGVSICQIVQSCRAVNCPAYASKVMGLEDAVAVVECDTALFDKDNELIEFVISHVESEFCQIDSNFSID